MATTAKPTASNGSRWSRWLASGRGRRLAIGVAVGWIALVGVTIWRMQSLDGLPDVGDPFEVTEAGRPVEIPDADNAFVAYAAAKAKLGNTRNQVDDARMTLLWDSVWNNDLKPLTWSLASTDLRDDLEAKRAALEVWREGSGRRDALYHQPGLMKINTRLSLMPDTIHFAGLATLEGSRLEDAGKQDEAWDWYHAILRSSRLVGRHGGFVQRLYGERIHALAVRCILRWAADPRVGATQLRRALHDTLTADALTPPVSEAIKIDYLMAFRPVENMTDFEGMMRSSGLMIPLAGGREMGLLDRLVPWGAVRLPVQRMRLGASNELERARRAFRLLFANWLAQVDRPAGRRAPLALRKPIWIYADDPSAPAAARAVTPEFLARVLDRSEIAAMLFLDRSVQSDPPWEGGGELARERRRRSVLIVRLAAELYRRERGAAPATAGALLETILEELPEGIAAADSIPASLE